MRDSLIDLLQHAALVARSIAIAEDDESGTSPSQARLIARIRTDGTSTVGSLARELGVTPVSASRMVERLVGYGYVKPRTLSKRGTPVVLTRLGLSARALALPVGQLDEEIARGLSAPEVEQLKGLLRKVIRRGSVRRDSAHTGSAPTASARAGAHAPARASSS